MKENVIITGMINILQFRQQTRLYLFKIKEAQESYLKCKKKLILSYLKEMYY